MKGKYMTRHESREIAFLLIFEKAFAEVDAENSLIIENAKEARETKVSSYATSLFQGVTEKMDELDNLVEKYSNNWSIKRISKVSLAALRLAFYELNYEDDVDNNIIISEIVELTKTYGGDDDSSFVNGILGSYFRDGDNK